MAKRYSFKVDRNPVARRTAFLTKDGRILLEGELVHDRFGVELYKVDERGWEIACLRVGRRGKLLSFWATRSKTAVEVMLDSRSRKWQVGERLWTCRGDTVLCYKVEGGRVGSLVRAVPLREATELEKALVYQDRVSENRLSLRGGWVIEAGVQAVTLCRQFCSGLFLKVTRSWFGDLPYLPSALKSVLEVAFTLEEGKLGWFFGDNPPYWFPKVEVLDATIREGRATPPFFIVEVLPLETEEELLGRALQTADNLELVNREVTLADFPKEVRKCFLFKKIREELGNPDSVRLSEIPTTYRVRYAGVLAAASASAWLREKRETEETKEE